MRRTEQSNWGGRPEAVLKKSVRRFRNSLGRTEEVKVFKYPSSSCSWEHKIPVFMMSFLTLFHGQVGMDGTLEVPLSERVTTRAKHKVDVSENICPGAVISLTQESSFMFHTLAKHLTMIYSWSIPVCILSMKVWYMGHYKFRPRLARWIAWYVTKMTKLVPYCSLHVHRKKSWLNYLISITVCQL